MAKALEERDNEPKAADPEEAAPAATRLLQFLLPVEKRRYFILVLIVQSDRIFYFLGHRF